MANTTHALRSPHLQEILDKARPRHEPETEEASLREAQYAMSTPMLDVVFRNGKIRSFGYAYLSEVEFEPGDTLTLKFTHGAQVILEGRNLGEHRQKIRLHRAAEIRECSASELTTQAEGVSQIEKIHIVEGEAL